MQGTFEGDIKDNSIHLIEEKPFDQKLCISIWKPEGEKDDIPNELREKIASALREKFEGQQKVKEGIPIPQAQEIDKKEEDDVW